MRQSKIKTVLLAFVIVSVAFLLAASPSFTEETARSQVASSFATGPSPLESRGIKSTPVRPGEEIPDWLARWELARVFSYVQRYDESIAEYEKVLKEKPDLQEARIEMARVLFWKGEQVAAVRILEKIPQTDLTGDAQVLMADLLIARKDYEKAAALYTSYLEKHPRDHAVRLKLADMLSWQKQYDASLDAYRNVLEDRPDDIQVRRRYAFVLIWAGKHIEAAAELKKTLE